MIRTFQTRFIAAAMASIFIVLSIILLVASCLNYRNMVQEADHTLSILQENGGTFPTSRQTGSGESASDNESSRQTDSDAGQIPGTQKGSPPDSKTGQNPIPPELPFESRYFSVVLNDSGEVIASDLKKIAAVNEETAISYARSVTEKSRTSGFLHGYRYICQSSHGRTQVIFLDCLKSLSTFRTFLLTSILTSLGGMLAVFVLVLLLSRQITRPVLESYQKQKRFITDAGHEIKMPLTIIQADADVLEMTGMDNEWLQDIRKQTEKLKDLTNNLIYLARMEEHQEKTIFLDFPISDLVAETADSFQTLARTRSQTLTWEIEPDLTCHGNAESIRKLLEILLDNALKYAPENGRIRLSLNQTRKGVELTVFNTADHLSRQDLPHLFERFYRLDESRNSETGGHGIGLSIAWAIVQAHKGKITASTEDEQSLTITVNL